MAFVNLQTGISHICFLFLLNKYPPLHRKKIICKCKDKHWILHILHLADFAVFYILINETLKCCAFNFSVGHGRMNQWRKTKIKYFKFWSSWVVLIVTKEVFEASNFYWWRTRTGRWAGPAGPVRRDSAFPSGLQHRVWDSGEPSGLSL